MKPISYRGDRFPPQVLHHAIGLYCRFQRRFRGVEACLARSRPAGAVEAVAQLIGRTPFTGTRDVVLAGGGAKNPVLVQRLRAVMKGQAVMLSDELGFPVDARESAGFAVLGALCRDGVPITLPQITGATTPGVAGRWVFPGVYK